MGENGYGDNMSRTMLCLQRKITLQGKEQIIKMEVDEDDVTIITDRYIKDDEGNRWNIVGDRKVESRRDPFG